ncbi:hypothetical protein FIU97_14940 [Roseivivax sp. THAF40]|uniref:hypothetical protein n=1 Tax=unclassified Roseivivax TaxID=2639302 RepID=UPI0012681529|nr:MULTISPECIES: hypothetical protein [unclassified Roseivivax]QFS84049.1 hypothetical protein FIV09_14530 [Roseivivax sp. THAF197b]QFT47876.1 hypothetical protein FIU97_14940 [Roseivivax sp. THAF40]
MRLSIPLCLTACLGLAACLSPLERCVEQANRSLWAAEAELRETEATLARGFALESVESSVPFYTTCYDEGLGQRVPCFEDVTSTRTVRVPVNLDEVRRRRDDLRREIAELRPAAEAAAQTCRATIPADT